MNKILNKIDYFNTIKLIYLIKNVGKQSSTEKYYF